MYPQERKRLGIINLKPAFLYLYLSIESYLNISYCEEIMGEQSTIWKNFIKNWKIYASPGKPSPDDISIVRKWLKKIKAKRVLLLGATPQLRDLLVELKCEAYTMDMQMDMLLGMQNYMKRKNPNEVIIKSDWLTSPLKDNYFDAILGDLILENIPYNQQPKLFSEIKRLLKKGAPWITKIFYPKDNLKDENPIDTINRIARMPYNINRYEELFIYFLFLTYNYKTKMCDVSKTEKMINYLL